VSMKIDAKEVETVLLDCLFKPEELVGGKPPSDAVLVEGITSKFGFHPGRLESHKGRIKAWLAALPPQFRKNSGGGWSFLNACMDADDNQWGEHRDVENLFSLGIGCGLAECQIPREMWRLFPGGMPYYAVNV
jgi:hypothetical protein